MAGLRRAALGASAALLLAGAVSAGGGPHNVLIVVNSQSADSVAVGNAYRAARGVPERNVCRLDIPLDAFRPEELLSAELFAERVTAPLEKFLAAHPAPDRLHYIVLCPDVPLRVDRAKPDRPRSLSATLTLLGVTQQGTAVNLYVKKRYAFERLPASDDADPVHRMRLVTILRGYKREDALDLVRRGIEADGTAPKGTFHFVLSPHTRWFPETVQWLIEHGYEAELHEKDKAPRDLKEVMGHFSGGSYSGLAWQDFSSYTYRPGAVVDMLESYGAEWQNWRGFGYLRQVPVPWVIRSGATGVHGTTDEPYAGPFPSSGFSRDFFANYLDGCNLAEAYWSAIPVLQWQNAVFGDPLCAPYAVRPKVTVAKGEGGGVSVSVGHGERPAPAEARLFIDGRFIGATDNYLVSDGGTATYSFDLASANLVPGTHRVRAVAVDASPAAVQGWGIMDLAIGDAQAAPVIALSEPPSSAAAGDSLCLTTTWKGDAAVVLRAGLRDLGTFRDGRLTLDTSSLGPGTHELQAASIGCDGKTATLGNFLELALAEPRHVVRSLPGDAVGLRPIFLLRYNEPMPFAPAVLARAVRLVQGRTSVAVRAAVNGRNVVIEPRTSLKAGIECRLTVDFPQDETRSRSYSRTFVPTDDADLLYRLPEDVRDTMTVDGLVSVRGDLFWPFAGRAAKVVLGPVDLFDPKRPALWSLPAYGVEARIKVTEKARPAKKDNLGAGLGVLYSDIDHCAYVRVEREDVVVYQVLDGRTTRAASWPAPGATTGFVPMRVDAVGPEVTVTVHGKTLGKVMLDRSLPPGLPWVDLGAPNGVSASQVRVVRR